MPYRHIAVLSRGEVTVVAIAKASLAAINEESDHPNPVLGELCEEFVQATGAAPAGVVIDMRDTDYLDHASVAAVSRLAKLLMDRTEHRAICCSPAMKQVLDLCRIDHFCPSMTDLDIAVARARN